MESTRLDCQTPAMAMAIASATTSWQEAQNSLSHFGKRPASPRSPRSQSLPPSFLYGSRVPTGGLRNSAFGDVHGIMHRSHGPALRAFPSRSQRVFQKVPISFTCSQWFPRTTFAYRPRRGSRSPSAPKACQSA